MILFTINRGYQVLKRITVAPETYDCNILLKQPVQEYYSFSFWEYPVLVCFPEIVQNSGFWMLNYTSSFLVSYKFSTFMLFFCKKKSLS